MYVLGVDISTSTIGIVILNEKKELIYYTYLKPKGDTLLQKIDSITKDIELIFTTYKIDKIICETPSISFNPGQSSAQVLATILRFNGIIHYLLNLFSGLNIQEIMASSARKKVTGRGTYPSGTAKREIFNWIKRTYTIPKNFPIKKMGKNKGDYANECYDICDAWVVALSSFYLQ